ncbi:MAG: OadG family protein [Clostridiales bacterium]|nr:OadG family protein [Clostridiales bacterium]
MSLDQKVQLSLIVLLTGLVIVFVMLIFLTFIIKGYSAVIKNIQPNAKADPVPKSVPAVQKASAPVPSVEAGIPEETVAAIAAAVYAMYGSSAGKIKSIRRAAQPGRSLWRMAGLLENTRPF